MSRAQARYKANFDKKTFAKSRQSRILILFLDMSEATKAKDKLTPKVAGPFKFLDVARLTVLFQCGDLVKQVSVDCVTRSAAPEDEGREMTKNDTSSPESIVAVRPSTSKRSWHMKSKLVGPPPSRYEGRQIGRPRGSNARKSLRKRSLDTPSPTNIAAKSTSAPPPSHS